MNTHTQTSVWYVWAVISDWMYHEKQKTHSVASFVWCSRVYQSFWDTSQLQLYFKTLKLQLNFFCRNLDKLLCCAWPCVLQPHKEGWFVFMCLFLGWQEEVGFKKKNLAFVLSFSYQNLTLMQSAYWTLTQTHLSWFSGSLKPKMWIWHEEFKNKLILIQN